MGKRNKRRTKYVPFKLSEKEPGSTEGEVEVDAEESDDQFTESGQENLGQGSVLDEPVTDGDQSQCSVDPTHWMKHSRLVKHVKKCVKDYGAYGCPYYFYHVFFTSRDLKSHLEECSKRMVNDLLPPNSTEGRANTSPPRSDASSEERWDPPCSDEDFRLTEDKGATKHTPEFMRNPAYMAMLVHQLRAKKPGMPKAVRKNWDRGEKNRIAALIEGRRFTDSICEDCQIPKIVKDHYNSSLPPEADSTYIPVGMSQLSIHPNGASDSRPYRQRRTTTVEPREVFEEPSGSSQASGTVEDCEWITNTRRRRK